MEKIAQQQEDEKSKALLDLKERVNELECLYAIEGVLGFSDKPLEATIADIVNMIPTAMRYSNIASAKINIKNSEFKSVDFKETKWKEEHDILVYDKKAGILAIYYAEERRADEEEKELLEAISQRLARYYERKQMEERLKESRAELELRVKVRTAEFTKTNEDLLHQIDERKKVEKGLRDSEERYRVLFENNPIPTVVYDMETLKFLSVNDSALAHFGYTREEALSMTIKDMLLAEDIPAILDIVAKLQDKDSDAIGVWRLRKKDGSIALMDIISHSVNFSGRKAQMVQTINVTEKSKMEQSLRKQERFLNSVFASIQDGISILDTDMRIIKVNPTMEKWYAHAMPIVGKKCYEAYYGKNKACKICPTARTLATKEVAREIVSKVGENGEVIGWFELYSFPMIDQETVALTGVIEYVRDISAEMQAKEETSKLTEEVLRSNKRLKEVSLTDPHTELFNYRFLENAIEAEFYRAKRYIQALSVIMLDIDYFKSVNDVYGHHFGDIVLKQFAKELKRLVRRYDYVIRSGGEEFIIVSPNIDRSQAIGLAQRLLEALSIHTFGDKKHTVKLKLSMSVVSYPEDKAKDGASLINLADRILEKAKELGGNMVYSAIDIGSVKERPGTHANGTKISEVKHLRSKIDKLTKKTNQGLVESILALAKTIELKDHTTGEHVEHTVHYVSEIAKALGLSHEDTELVRQASILHDLGKIGVSEKILNKKAKLSKRDFDEIKKHPQIAADILRPVQFLHGLIPFIFYHHERWDGRGYPSGIKGDEIPIGARIIAIADVYEALTSNRPYRKAYSKDKAIQIIKDGSGKQFDPRIVSVFLKIIGAEKSRIK